MGGHRPASLNLFYDDFSLNLHLLHEQFNVPMIFLEFFFLNSGFTVLVFQQGSLVKNLVLFKNKHIILHVLFSSWSLTNMD